MILGSCPGQKSEGADSSVWGTRLWGGLWARLRARLRAPVQSPFEFPLEAPLVKSPVLAVPAEAAVLVSADMDTTARYIHAIESLGGSIAQAVLLAAEHLVLSLAAEQPAPVLGTG